MCVWYFPALYNAHILVQPKAVTLGFCCITAFYNSGKESALCISQRQVEDAVSGLVGVGRPSCIHDRIPRKARSPCLFGFLLQDSPGEKWKEGLQHSQDPLDRSGGKEHTPQRRWRCVPDRDSIWPFDLMALENGRWLLGFTLTFNVKGNPDFQSQQ